MCLYTGLYGRISPVNAFNNLALSRRTSIPPENAMKRILLFGLMFFVAVPAIAQLPQIRITAVFPSGAQQGTSFDVTVTAGSDLDEAAELVFNHPGLKATPKLDGAGNVVPSQFVVTVDPAVAPGLYDVRVRGLFGISNPRIFRVDSCVEVLETEPNNIPEQAQPVAMETIVNARSNGATDVDMFSVSVNANQTVVFRTEAAVLDSLMQPVLELFDASGRRVFQSRRSKQQEAVIVYTSPVDQTLTLKVHDIAYGGGNDYGYRLSIDTRPQIDFVSPQIVQSGVDTAVTIYGRHVPGGVAADLNLFGTPLQKQEVVVNLTSSELNALGTDSSAMSVDSAIYSGIDGNLIPFAIRQNTSQTIQESVNVEAAQSISAPCHVSGSFSKELDEDTYRFEARKGEQWQIDILAHRLGSPADPMLFVEQVVTAADGTESLKRLTREDEGKQNPGGGNLPTLTSDPSFILNAPEDGVYQLRLKDRFAASRGATNLTYTLSIEPAMPDFQVVVFDSLPSADGKAPATTGAISLRKGGTYEVPVYAYRQGGHNAEISLRAEGLPPGITMANAGINSGSNSTMVVFTALPDAEELIVPVRLIAASTVGDKVIEHAASVATLVHGGSNGLPRTARVTGSLLAGVMKDEEPFSIQPELVSAEITQDQQLLIPIKLVRRAGFDGKVDIAFAGQPGNVDIPTVSIDKGQDSAIARFYFKDNAAVGPASLLMYGTSAVPYSRNPWQVERAKQQVVAATEKLTADQKLLADAMIASETSVKKVTELASALAAYETELATEVAAQKKTQEELKTAIAEKADAAKQLVALQERLNTAAANQSPDGAELDAAIKLVDDATSAVNEASRPVVALVERINGINSQIAAKQKLILEKNKQIADSRTEMTSQMQVVETAKAAVTSAEATLKDAEAKKKAAEEVTKKAEEAAKPKNINVRSIAIPVQLNVYATPGKITAAIADAGAIKKGATAEVKVTLARKNGFAGAAKVSLVLPEGITGLTSNTVEIGADQTEATLSLTAAADAAPADIANAVIRASAEFNGRVASFDSAIALKITE